LDAARSDSSPISRFAFLAARIAFQRINQLGLRASNEKQDFGLDFTEHSGAASRDFMTGDQKVPPPNIVCATRPSSRPIGKIRVATDRWRIFEAKIDVKNQKI
jgi:hypothetical protein